MPLRGGVAVLGNSRFCAESLSRKEDLVHGSHTLAPECVFCSLNLQAGKVTSLRQHKCGEAGTLPLERFCPLRNKAHLRYDKLDTHLCSVHIASGLPRHSCQVVRTPLRARAHRCHNMDRQHFRMPRRERWPFYSHLPSSRNRATRSDDTKARLRPEERREGDSWLLAIFILLLKISLTSYISRAAVLWRRTVRVTVCSTVLLASHHDNFPALKYRGAWRPAASYLTLLEQLSYRVPLNRVSVNVIWSVA